MSYPTTGKQRNRDRPMVSMTLDIITIETADELAAARGTTRSGLVEQLIQDEGLRMRIDLERAKRRAKKKWGLAAFHP